MLGRRAFVLLALAALAATPVLGALQCAETKWGENGKQESVLKTVFDVADNNACAALCESTPGCTNYKFCRSGLGTTNVCTEHYTMGGPDLKIGECRLGSGKILPATNDGSYGAIVLGQDCKSDATPAAAAPTPAAAAPTPAAAAAPTPAAAAPKPAAKPPAKAPSPAPSAGGAVTLPAAVSPSPAGGAVTLPAATSPAPAPAAAAPAPGKPGNGGGKPSKPPAPAPSPAGGAVTLPAAVSPAPSPSKGAPIKPPPSPAPSPAVAAPAPGPAECLKPGDKQPRGAKLPACPPSPPTGGGGSSGGAVVVPPIYKPPVADCRPGNGPQPRGGAAATKPVCPDTVLPITPERPPTCILPGQPQPRDADALPLCPPVTVTPPIANCVEPPAPGAPQPRDGVLICPPTVKPITPEVKPQCILPGQPQPRDADALPLCPVPLEPSSPAPAPAVAAPAPAPSTDCLKPGDKQPRGKNLPPCGGPDVQPAPLPTVVPIAPIIPPRPTTKPTPKPTENPPPETPSPFLPPTDAKPLPGVPSVPVAPPNPDLPTPSLPVIPQSPPPPGEPAPAPPACPGGKQPSCRWFIRDVPCCSGAIGLTTDKPAVQLELFCTAPITLPPECLRVQFGANRAIKSSYWPAFNSYTASNFRYVLNHLDNEPLYANTEKGTLDAQVSIDVEANRAADSKLPQCTLPLATPCTAGGERATTVAPIDRITWTSTVYNTNSSLFKANAAAYNVTAATPWNNYAWSLPPPKQARDGGGKPAADGPLCEEALLWELKPKFWSDGGWADAKGRARTCSEADGLGVGYVGGAAASTKPSRPK